MTKFNTPVGVALCPVREQCWRDLNAAAIERGGSKERKFYCGYEIARTLCNCPRQGRYPTLQSAVQQLTMQLS
jgi:hypothetical protein